MTPHISAAPGDFARVVIMPGDPLRARFIAEQFLTDSMEVNRVRNMLGFTGYYDGCRLSVMASGMGIPSMLIYARELFSAYGVQTIIRTGSCGAISPALQPGDIVLAQAACTDSAVNRAFFNGYDFAAVPDIDLLCNARDRACELHTPVCTGSVMTTDTFYPPHESIYEVMRTAGVIAVDMETAGLYSMAARCRGRALAMYTVSDCIGAPEKTLSARERETGFSAMIRLALETARAVEQQERE